MKFGGKGKSRWKQLIVGRAHARGISAGNSDGGESSAAMFAGARAQNWICVFYPLLWQIKLGNLLLENRRRDKNTWVLCYLLWKAGYSYLENNNNGRWAILQTNLGCNQRSRPSNQWDANGTIVSLCNCRKRFVHELVQTVRSWYVSYNPILIR